MLLIVLHFLTAHWGQWGQVVEEGSLAVRRLKVIHVNQQVFTGLMELHLLSVATRL